MRKTVIFSIILAFIAGSCGQATKKQAETANSGTVDKQEEETGFQADKTCTGIFEYVDYNALYDYPFFVVKKDNQILTLIDDCPIGNVPALNRGDIVEIQWKTDSVQTAGDNNTAHKAELAVNIRKTGELSVFRKTNSKPRSYIFMENNLPEAYQTAVINEVEYFLANTTDKNISQYLNDEKGDIQIYISRYKDGEAGKGYPSITARIDNYVESEHTLIQLGIELDNENYERIYYQFDKDKKEYIRFE